MTCFLCISRVFLEICINLKIELKKTSVQYIKKSILNTKQKIFQKHYSFNRYVSDKFQILKKILKYL
jgi:hypothetical protein